MRGFYWLLYINSLEDLTRLWRSYPVSQEPLIPLKAGFHLRRSRSRMCIVKHRAIRSRESQSDVERNEIPNSPLIPSLMINEIYFVRVASRSGRINQSQCSIPGLVIRWFFRSDNLQFSQNHKRRNKKNGNVLILPYQIPSSL